MQMNSEAEEAKLDAIVKPEYLKQNMNQNINIPTEVAWRECAHQSETTSITFNRDGSVIYTGGGDGHVKAWNSKTGKQVGQMTGFQSSVLDVSASLDDEYVVACSTDQNKIMLFRTKTYNRLTTYMGHTDTINAVKCNYGKKGIISASMDRTIRHWDMMTGKQQRADSCPLQIYNIDISHSEAIMVSTHSKEMRIWNVKQGGEIHTLHNAHSDSVTCARFTSDERYIVSTGNDHIVKVWDVRKWQ